MPLKRKILIGIGIFLGVLLLIGCGVFIYGQNLLGKMKFDDGSQIETQKESFDTEKTKEDLETVLPDEVDFNNEDFEGRNESGIYNILLLGEDHEEKTGEYRGNTDAMIVVTLNTKNHSVKLTSFMRDMYVQIPGYQENKLNSVYARGGIQLVYETFIKNFDLKLDGYLNVNFTTFEEIIDRLGGVELTLSQEEAEYLNSTNYIGKEEYRNVTEGTQHLNGSQALGYSRVRYVGNSDYERTQRQRNVLNAVFDQFRAKGLTELLDILKEVLPYMKTDMKPDKIIGIATQMLGANLKDIENFRIPIEGGFHDATIKGMQVLIVDYKENIEALHTFIFEEEDSLLKE